MAGEDGFMPATDVHVHLMPDRLIAAIHRALGEEAGWTFDHPTDREGIESLLSAAGVRRYFALPYAHKPEMSAELNWWVIDRADESEMAVPFATVHPEDEVGPVVRAAFDAGARGLKFQCPVQQCAPDDERLGPAFELAAEFDYPIVFHAGTAPMFDESPYVGVDRFASFLESYPDVKAACAHMGTYEWEAFVDLIAEYDNAFLDTSFAMSAAAGASMRFSPEAIPDRVFETHSASIMYGSDLPNLPHEYADERRHLLGRSFERSVYDDLFRRTAERFLTGTAPED
jgi:predicted TIM-barrel fold metal-dependent hydrolase